MSWPEFWSRFCHGERLLVTGDGNGLCGPLFLENGDRDIILADMGCCTFYGQHLERGRRTKWSEEAKLCKEKTTRKLLPQVTQDWRSAASGPLRMPFPSHGSLLPHTSGWPISSLLLYLCSHYHLLSEASLTTPLENVTPPQYFLFSFSVLFLFPYYLSPSNIIVSFTYLLYLWDTSSH